ncbi:MAG: hypothetical protein R3247_15045, partial [Rhodothermales bacterium]|nr:hypothetical protein [Rhodothermales bacterium]
TAGLDLRAAHETGLLRLLRFPSADALRALDDDVRPRTLTDLVTLVRRHGPRRLVLDEAQPFLAFREAERFRPAFMHFLAQLDALELTLLMTLTAPEDAKTRPLAAFIGEQMAGVLTLEADPEHPAPRLALRPQRGHHHQEAVVQLDPAAFPPAVLAPSTHPAFAPLAGPGALGWDLEDTEVDRTLPPEQPPADAAGFSLRLQRRFQEHALHGTPFLLVALRADAGTAQGLDLDPLFDCSRALLGATDDHFFDANRRRLVLTLAPRDDQAAHRFFARLRARLRARLGASADEYLQAVTAIVAADGDGYTSAEDFLNTVMED